MRSSVKFGLGVLCGVLLVLVALYAGRRERPQPTTVPEPKPPISERLAPEPLSITEGTHSRFAVLAQEAAPGVVNVHTSKTIVRAPLPQFPDLFREFFGGPFGERFGQPRGRGRGQQEFSVPSLGSGFVVSADGYVVTNNHVVDGVDLIEVQFHDRRKLEAEIVGQDPKTDIALIRVKGAEDLHVLNLGDSDALLPGDWVVAIGNPFGLDHTVTVGIVSATGRDIGQGPYDDFIQTDAAINPGNSGGPLLNLAGEVVGVNTAINPRANTIGFAVPSNMVGEILPQLRESGSVTRGWLGVSVQTVTPELAEVFDLDEEHGALVAQVMPDSPAEDAGIERGDVIVRFNDQEVREMRDLPRAVAHTPVGERVAVEVVRDGKSRTFDVEIGELEEPREVARRGGVGPGGEALGMVVRNITPGIRQRFNLEASEGVVITQVEPGSRAAEAGLQPRDIILEVNGKAVEDVADLNEKIEGEDRVLFLVRRGESTLYVAVKR
jgi:serine protease Do